MVDNVSLFRSISSCVVEVKNGKSSVFHHAFACQCGQRRHITIKAVSYVIPYSASATQAFDALKL